MKAAGPVGRPLASAAQLIGAACLSTAVSYRQAGRRGHLRAYYAQQWAFGRPMQPGIIYRTGAQLRGCNLLGLARALQAVKEVLGLSWSNFYVISDAAATSCVPHLRSKTCNQSTTTPASAGKRLSPTIKQASKQASKQRKHALTHARTYARRQANPWVGKGCLSSRLRACRHAD